MTNYVSNEKGKRQGIVVHDLSADGAVIAENITVTEVRKLMRETMKPGDTWQETYPDGGSTSAIPYEDMLKSWKKDDAFERGEEYLEPGDTTTPEVKQATGRIGGTGRIIVDTCPYCAHTHYHSIGDSRDNLQRLADCGKGEYVIKLESR